MGSLGYFQAGKEVHSVGTGSWATNGMQNSPQSMQTVQKVGGEGRHVTANCIAVWGRVGAACLLSQASTPHIFTFTCLQLLNLSVVTIEVDGGQVWDRVYIQ